MKYGKINLEHYIQINLFVLIHSCLMILTSSVGHARPNYNLQKLKAKSKLLIIFAFV